MRKLSLVHRYVLVVSALGLAAFAWLLATGDVGAILSARALVFATFVFLGELLPITVPRQGEADQITTSTTFALAMVLTVGPLPAVVAQVCSSVVADAARRKPMWKIGFNAAQYCLALSAAALTIHLMTGPTPAADHLAVADLPAIFVAGAVLFVVNTSLTGVALALAQGVPVFNYLRRDLLFQAATDGLLVALAPIVVLTSERSLLLVPIVAAPMLAVYQSTRASLERASLVRRLEDSLSDLQEMNRLNEHQALHDALTGLPNRTLFLDRVGQAIRAARREGHALALLMIDLDRFKDINDTLGHHLGDELLRQVGQRFRDTLRESDTTARLGGDEFAILVPKLEENGEAVEIADRIRRALETTFTVEGLTLEVEASIGIAKFPDHGVDGDTLIQHADLAMYVAKSGRLGFQVYAPAYDQHSRSRLALLGELRRAIDEGQLVLHFQPKIDLASGQVAGMEALLRWQHPSRTLLPPAAFVPFAEHTGLIRPLTAFILDAALRQSREWRMDGLELNVAVNLSARNVVDPELLWDVSGTLERWQVPPEALELEITESALMGEPVRAMEVLSGLSAAGVTLSLDDFGTGYSSLALLKRLPVNEIKIDRSFVMNMTANESDAVIVRSTIDLAHNLGLRVVAEGVETQQTCDLLVDLECDVAQGFFFGRPMPASDVPRWIKDWRARGGLPREKGRRVEAEPSVVVDHPQPLTGGASLRQVGGS
jgi:diguanylate cyclase (GGDEF)-like protein